MPVPICDDLPSPAAVSTGVAHALSEATRNFTALSRSGRETTSVYSVFARALWPDHLMSPFEAGSYFGDADHQWRKKAVVLMHKAFVNAMASLMKIPSFEAPHTLERLRVWGAAKPPSDLVCPQCKQALDSDGDCTNDPEQCVLSYKNGAMRGGERDSYFGRPCNSEGQAPYLLAVSPAADTAAPAKADSRRAVTSAMERIKQNAATQADTVASIVRRAGGRAA